MNTMDATREIAARLDQRIAREQKAWQEILDSHAQGWAAYDRLEYAEHVMRASLDAHHAVQAKKALDESGLDGLQKHLDGLAQRLIDGGFLQRSTSLFSRARGEVEHEAVRDLVREVRGLLAFARETAR